MLDPARAEVEVQSIEVKMRQFELGPRSKSERASRFEVKIRASLEIREVEIQPEASQSRSNARPCEVEMHRVESKFELFELHSRNST